MLECNDDDTAQHDAAHNSNASTTSNKCLQLHTEWHKRAKQTDL